LRPTQSYAKKTSTQVIWLRESDLKRNNRKLKKKLTEEKNETRANDYVSLPMRGIFSTMAREDEEA
jgi:hypothetical protein